MKWFINLYKKGRIWQLTKKYHDLAKAELSLLIAGPRCFELNVVQQKLSEIQAKKDTIKAQFTPLGAEFPVVEEDTLIQMVPEKVKYVAIDFTATVTGIQVTPVK